MIMIGDSCERDIVPAAQAGIYCIHYTDSVPASDEEMKTNDFGSLQTLLETAHRGSKA